MATSLVPLNEIVHDTGMQGGHIRLGSGRRRRIDIRPGAVARGNHLYEGLVILVCANIDKVVYDRLVRLNKRVSEIPR
jgi:hypothetical protein